MMKTSFSTSLQVCSYILAFANKSVYGKFLLVTHISLHVILGRYYAVDAGYPNRPRYLAPYKGARYHVPDWRRVPAPSGEHEHFNHLHSSIQNAVERAFGVLKMKWRILLKMPSFPLDKQKMIVATTMCLHNFIRENNAQDKDFYGCDWVLIMCPLYRQDIQDIFIMQEIHQLRNLTIGPWIDFGMILHGQSFLLDHHEHVSMVIWFM
jgi:hypothetical protein